MTLTDQIINSLRQEPERWVEDEHHLINAHKKVWLWTINGKFYMHVAVSPKGYVRLSFKSKWRIWQAIKYWRKLPLESIS
jgi:hypothetical protein